jgi:TM2 domain-containing membrane protein YozV
MFCRNCGKELTGAPEICLGCGARPLSGNSYCNACGAETNAMAEICVTCGVRLGKTEEGDISPKSRLATTLLAWFLGVLGAHRFYTGKTGTAVTMLALTIIGWATVWFFIGIIFIVAVGIWALLDFIVTVSGSATDNEGKLITKW